MHRVARQIDLTAVFDLKVAVRVVFVAALIFRGRVDQAFPVDAVTRRIFRRTLTLASPAIVDVRRQVDFATVTSAPVAICEVSLAIENAHA
jgi:hypothetical protein